MRKPTAEERQAIADAVHAAEAGTSGEIVTIIAERSDRYHDVALLYAVLAMLLVPALFATSPGLPDAILGLVTGGWSIPSPRELILVTFASTAMIGAMTYAVLCSLPLRLAITPRALRRQRVRRRAIELFRVGTEARTVGRTGILIYLSLGERMAEIVADQAIHTAVPNERWGDAMAALVANVREGRIADGMIDAIGKVGAILIANLARASDDANELPDRLIEL